MTHKFIVDAMLGKLGRWMLLLGYDVICFRGHADEELMEIAEKQGRIIITRDTHLALERSPRNSFLIKCIYFLEQLEQIVHEFPLDFSRTFLSRCSHCNVLIIEVDKEDIMDELPEKVRQWATKFYRCPACGKLYWNGTHTLHIRKLIEERLGLVI